MPIRVECYAGYRAEQEPLAFLCGERRLEVRAIVDRWFARDSMTTLRNVRTLTCYMAWANDRIFDVVAALIP